MREKKRMWELGNGKSDPENRRVRNLEREAWAQRCQALHLLQQKNQTILFPFSSVQALSHVWLFANPWTEAHQLPCPPLSPRVWSSTCPLSQWCYPTISSSATPLLLLPSTFSSIWVFSNELALRIRWPKGWSFSTNPSNEYSELISFRTDSFDCLAVQGTLKSFLQHQSLKAPILRALPSFGPTLTSIHDYWKSHSFDCTDPKWCLHFLTHCLALSQLFL